MKSWNETLALHDRVVAEYAAAAAAVREWDAQPAPRKWSAAQITAHLNLSFEAILCELRGGPPMALRTRPLQRLAMRFTIQRRLMRGGKFPSGAPAPRETRPPETTLGRDAAIAEFNRLAREVNDAIDVARKQPGPLRFRHPYFGYVPAVDGLYISARHIDHHRAQIAGR